MFLFLTCLEWEWYSATFAYHTQVTLDKNINGPWLDALCIPDIIVTGLIVIDNVSVLHIYGRVHVHIFIKGVLLSTW